MLLSYLNTERNRAIEMEPYCIIEKYSRGGEGYADSINLVLRRHFQHFPDSFLYQSARDHWTETCLRANLNFSLRDYLRIQYVSDSTNQIDLTICGSKRATRGFIYKNFLKNAKSNEYMQMKSSQKN